VKNASRYISLKGMFEVKEGFEYKLLDSDINKDLNTWKDYETIIKDNEYGLKELKVDMSDVILNGTSDGTESMSFIIPRFQIRTNERTFGIDVIRACRNNRFDKPWNQYGPDEIIAPACSETLNLNVVNVVNTLIEWYNIDSLLID
jgi:hypothetical protein